MDEDDEEVLTLSAVVASAENDVSSVVRVGFATGLHVAADHS